MEKQKVILFVTVTAAIFIQSCSVSKTKIVQYAIDPICKMKVDVKDAFSFKYDGHEYYFDSYNCQEAFKMNPENYTNKKTNTSK